VSYCLSSSCTFSRLFDTTCVAWSLYFHRALAVWSWKAYEWRASWNLTKPDLYRWFTLFKFFVRIFIPLIRYCIVDDSLAFISLGWSWAYWRGSFNVRRCQTIAAIYDAYRFGLQEWIGPASPAAGWLTYSTAMWYLFRSVTCREGFALVDVRRSFMAGCLRHYLCSIPYRAIAVILSVWHMATIYLTCVGGVWLFAIGHHAWVMLIHRPVSSALSPRIRCFDGCDSPVGNRLSYFGVILIALGLGKYSYFLISVLIIYEPMDCFWHGSNKLNFAWGKNMRYNKKKLA